MAPLAPVPAPLPVPPTVLVGGTYLHLPSGRPVVVLDNEYDHAPRPPTRSAQTGRYVVRSTTGHALPFVAASEDLAPLPASVR